MADDASSVETPLFKITRRVVYYLRLLIIYRLFFLISNTGAFHDKGTPGVATGSADR